jgi:DNA repair exonuclease SbcCD ATPase subunit
MSLNPITLVERLIEEHGSSSIQGKHLAMLKDEIAILQRKTTDLSTKVEQLESENRELLSQLQQRAAEIQRLQPSTPPGDKCPYCNRTTGVLEEIKPHPEEMFAMLGVKHGFYKCSNPQCAKSYDKEMKM